MKSLSFRAHRFGRIGFIIVILASGAISMFSQNTLAMPTATELSLIQLSYQPQISVRVKGHGRSIMGCELRSATLSVADAVTGEPAKIRVKEYWPRETAAPTSPLASAHSAVILVPPTGGENIIDRTYANQLCKGGFRVALIQHWSHDAESSLEISMHDRQALRGLASIRHVSHYLRTTGVVHVGILGTSVGALAAEMAVGYSQNIESAVLIAGGVGLPEIIAHSKVAYLEKLKRQREEAAHVDDIGYLKWLRAGLHFEPGDFLGYSGPKEVMTVMALQDTRVPTENQIQLHQRLVETGYHVQTSEMRGDHFPVIIQSSLQMGAKFVEFFRRTLDHAQPRLHTSWSATWGASAQPSHKPMAVENQTLREVAHISRGGHRFRVHFSNVFGTEPLKIGEAYIDNSARASVGEAMPGLSSILEVGRRISSAAITVRGSTSFIVQPGEEVLSDPINLDCDDWGDLGVNMYFPERTLLSTYHAIADSTVVVSQPGNYTVNPEFPVQYKHDSLYAMTAIDVESAAPSRTVIAVGDSITDGVGATENQDHRWPDELARRLLDGRNNGLAVINEGIGFNKVLSQQTDNQQPSQSLLERFDRDVLAQSGARYVIVLDGVNDLGATSDGINTDEFVAKITSAYTQLIRRGHAHGLKVYGGTLTSIGHSGYDSVQHREIFAKINHWIRTSGAFDAVIDFELALADHLHPEQLRAIYDSGDHLHPNDRGYAAMAGAIPVTLFQN